MEPEPGRLRPVQAASMVASYVLWLVTAGLGIVDILIARGLIIETAYALDISPWSHGAIDKFGLVILGVGWLILTYGAEAYYRRAAEISLRKLLRTFALATVIQVAFGGLATLATILMS